MKLKMGLEIVLKVPKNHLVGYLIVIFASQILLEDNA